MRCVYREKPCWCAGRGVALKSHKKSWSMQCLGQIQCLQDGPKRNLQDPLILMTRFLGIASSHSLLMPRLHKMPRSIPARYPKEPPGISSPWCCWEAFCRYLQESCLWPEGISCNLGGILPVSSGILPVRVAHLVQPSPGAVLTVPSGILTLARGTLCPAPEQVMFFTHLPSARSSGKSKRRPRESLRTRVSPPRLPQSDGGGPHRAGLTQLEPFLL